MSGITLAQAEAQLAVWLAASEKIAAKQSYAINGRSLTFADLADVQKQIDYWQNWVTKLTRSASGRGRVRYIVGE